MMVEKEKETTIGRIRRLTRELRENVLPLCEIDDAETWLRKQMAEAKRRGEWWDFRRAVNDVTECQLVRFVLMNGPDYEIKYPNLNPDRSRESASGAGAKK